MLNLCGFYPHVRPLQYIWVFHICHSVLPLFISPITTTTFINLPSYLPIDITLVEFIFCIPIFFLHTDNFQFFFLFSSLALTNCLISLLKSLDLLLHIGSPIGQVQYSVLQLLRIKNSLR